jgi:hypothetical protein
MAVPKAKRPILLAQLQPQQAKTGLAGGPKPQRRSTNHKPNPGPAGLMPVKANIYRAMAELNGGFQTVIHELQVLGQVGFLRLQGVTEMRKLICRVRAQANRDFTMAMHEREKTNADILACTP